MKTILEETIEEAIPEEDVLTRHIYHYESEIRPDRDDGGISVVN